MSTATENRRPANSSASLRRLVARHPVTAFLVMAFVFGWGGMLPLLLSENGPFGVVPIELLWMPFAAILSIFGLALPAFLVTAATDGKEGVRDLMGRILRWRVGVHWYLIALFGLLGATLLGAILFFGLAPLEELTQKWELLFTLFLWGGLWGILVPFVLVNLWEATGWTGFMQHTLQEQHGPLLASVMVTPFFALIRRRPIQKEVVPLDRRSYKAREGDLPDRGALSNVLAAKPLHLFPHQARVRNKRTLIPIRFPVNATESPRRSRTPSAQHREQCGRNLRPQIEGCGLNQK